MEEFVKLRRDSAIYDSGFMLLQLFLFLLILFIDGAIHPEFHGFFLLWSRIALTTSTKRYDFTAIVPSSIKQMRLDEIYQS